MMIVPEFIESEEQLEELLSIPSVELIEMMKIIDGDIMILGIAGKMGLTLGRRALNAIKAANVNKKVFGVARFSDPKAKDKLQAWGIETITCDLLDLESVKTLPQVANVIFMAGKKFGTDGCEDMTWAMNTIVPNNVVEHFKNSKIVAFSTGCVYPLVPASSGGCTEKDIPKPIGEYPQSCLGRERIFEYAAKKYNTKVLLFRLNYAIDLRYGVLHDIGLQIKNGEKIDNRVGNFNLIWQGDANDIALRALLLADSPAVKLNVTGPETININYIAEELGELMDKKIEYATESGKIGYLSNASKMFNLFGYPTISLAQMLKWQAHWFNCGGSSLGKPTHFEVADGKF